MCLRNLLVLCLSLCLIEAAFVGPPMINLEKGADSHTIKISSNTLEPLRINMEELRQCIDHSMAKAVDEINTKRLLPVFNVFGEQLDKVVKAFDDLTATKMN